MFLSPIVLFLSGISWPPEAISDILYSPGHIMPGSFMVPASLRVRAMGASVMDVSYELSGMLIQTGVYFLLAFRAVKLQLRRNATDC